LAGGADQDDGRGRRAGAPFQGAGEVGGRPGDEAGRTRAAGGSTMIRNLIGSDWQMPADGAVSLPVFNPATGEVIEQVPLSGAQEVDAAVKAASGAFASWSRTAVMERVRLMFRYKAVLEEHFEELASIVTRHHGKTLDESRGEVRRGIEVVDFACGATSFVGSAPVAKRVYTEAAARGKRVKALGGAKNHIVVMPDADPEITVPAILNAAFGNAGERCLSGSVAVAVGKAADILLDPLRDAASKMVVGPGDQPGVQVGPLIRAEHP